MKGKIIAVVGASASGKSFLVKKLAMHYKAVPFFEGEPRFKSVLVMVQRDRLDFEKEEDLKKLVDRIETRLNA